MLTYLDRVILFCFSFWEVVAFIIVVIYNQIDKIIRRIVQVPYLIEFYSISRHWNQKHVSIRFTAIDRYIKDSQKMVVVVLCGSEIKRIKSSLEFSFVSFENRLTNFFILAHIIQQSLQFSIAYLYIFSWKWSDKKKTTTSDSMWISPISRAQFYKARNVWKFVKINNNNNQFYMAMIEQNQSKVTVMNVNLTIIAMTIWIALLSPRKPVISNWNVSIRNQFKRFYSYTEFRNANRENGGGGGWSKMLMKCRLKRFFANNNF